MPSTYTASLRIEMQAAGENLNTWGAPRLNNAFSRFDKAIAGRTAVTLAGVNYTLTASNTLDDEARSILLDLSGTGGCQLIIPSVSKTYFVRNGSTGTVTVTTGAGTTVAIAANESDWVVCDGSGVFRQSIAGLSIRAYVDAQAWATVSASLPAQVGNSGKFLTTNGTTPSWASPTTSSLSDLATYTAAQQAFAVAMATAI